MVRIVRFTLLPGNPKRLLRSGSGSSNFGGKNSFGTASSNQIVSQFWFDLQKPDNLSLVPLTFVGPSSPKKVGNFALAKSRKSLENRSRCVAFGVFRKEV